MESEAMARMTPLPRHAYQERSVRSYRPTICRQNNRMPMTAPDTPPTTAQPEIAAVDASW
jgi:hypothetical protein